MASIDGYRDRIDVLQQQLTDSMAALAEIETLPRDRREQIETVLRRYRLGLTDARRRHFDRLVTAARIARRSEIETENGEANDAG
jgi:hypothetical protein